LERQIGTCYISHLPDEDYDETQKSLLSLDIDTAKKTIDVSQKLRREE